MNGISNQSRMLLGKILSTIYPAPSHLEASECVTGIIKKYQEQNGFQ